MECHTVFNVIKMPVLLKLIWIQSHSKPNFTGLKKRERQAGQVWWHRPVISVLRKLRQEDHKFKASLGYQGYKAKTKPKRMTCM
jgi:hypothetical protein